MSITVSPIRDADGTIVGASKVARDISERKRVDEEREEVLERERAARAEAEAANRAKDEFLAMLSHELRTPLNAILGWTQVLSNARHDPDTVTGRSRRSPAMRSSRRVSSRISSISRVFWPGSCGSISGRSISWPSSPRLWRRSVSRPAPRGWQIRTHFDPSVGPVSGDPERLQQIFWNLLSNAIKFTGRQGRVDLRLQRVHSRAVVTMSDTGIGIRPDMLPVIFERFRQADSSTTRAHAGLGLGLAIVKQLTELHDGTVVAASPGEGRGATFTVTLPVTR